MGHASRPRIDNALGLDAQSRRLCLSIAGRRHSHSNTDINTYRDPNSNSHCDGNFYTDIDTETYTHTEDCADAEAASYAATAAIMPELVMSD